MSEKERIKFIKKLAELDDIAEKAGGYVTPPNSVEHSEKFEEDFSAMRKYCFTHKKSFSELTLKDYEVIGIKPF